MNKFLALVLMTAALPCRAQQGGGQIFIEGIDIPAGLKGSVKEFKDARAPAPVDPKPVDELFARLSRPWAGHDGTLQGMGPVLRDGSQEVDVVSLVEISGPKRPEGLAVVDLVDRHYYSHIEARSEVWTDLPNGEKKIVVWQFQIGLDSVILSARRQVLVGKLLNPAGGSDGLAADKKRSSVQDFRPKDPAAAAQWKVLAPKLCALRPTLEA